MKEKAIPQRQYKKTRTDRERFFGLVNKTTTCWNWQGTLVGKGYGYFRLNNPRRKILAHRYSYELHFEVPAKHLQVMHKCDNPRCVNPYHLMLGTNMDNVQDMLRKGRNPHGETHYKRIAYLEKINGHTSRTL